MKLSSATAFKLWSKADADGDGKVTQKEWAAAATSAINERKNLLNEAEQKKINLLNMFPGGNSMAPLLEAMGQDISLFKRETNESKALTEQANAKNEEIEFLTKMAVGGKDHVGYSKTIGGDDGVDHVELTHLLEKDPDKVTISDDDFKAYGDIYVANDTSVDEKTDAGKANLAKLKELTTSTTTTNTDDRTNSLIKMLLKMFGIPEELLSAFTQ